MGLRGNTNLVAINETCAKIDDIIAKSIKYKTESDKNVISGPSKKKYDSGKECIVLRKLLL